MCVLLVHVPLALRRTARARCVFESIFKFRTIIFCIIALFNDITTHMPSYIVPCPSSYGAVLKKIKKKKTCRFVFGRRAVVVVGVLLSSSNQSLSLYPFVDMARKDVYSTTTYGRRTISENPARFLFVDNEGCCTHFFHIIFLLSFAVLRPHFYFICLMSLPQCGACVPSPLFARHSRFSSPIFLLKQKESLD